MTVSKGGEVADGAGTPLIMASVEINACERESNECWQNDGPHPVRVSLHYTTVAFLLLLKFPHCSKL